VKPAPRNALRKLSAKSALPLLTMRGKTKSKTTIAVVAAPAPGSVLELLAVEREGLARRIAAIDTAVGVLSAC
jgi:hypothetical protein